MNLITFLASVLAVICVFAPHEFAHAYVAYKNGDGTAKMYGRLTLNPLKHIDPYGFIMCALVGFGWAKPVPINPFNFKNYRFGLFTTAIAGICVNYVIAFIAYPLLLLSFAIVIEYGTLVFYLISFIQYTLELIFVYSLCSVVFNLLPLNPLDGFRIVESLTRPINPVHRFLKEYGQMILIILIVESFVCDVVLNLGVEGLEWIAYCDILGHVMNFATSVIGWPITALWDLILL